MAIIKMSKFKLLAFIDDREKLLGHLQDFSEVHFIKEEPPEDTVFSDRSTDLSAVVEEMTRVRYLIDSLTPYREGKKDPLALSLQEVKERAKDTNVSELYEKVSELLKKRDGIKNEVRSFEQKIEELVPWKSYDAPISELGKKRYTTRVLAIYGEHDRIGLEKKLTEEELHFEHLGEKEGNHYYFLCYLSEREDEVSEFLRAKSLTRVQPEGESAPEEEVENLKLKISEKNSALQTVERDLKNYVVELSDLEVCYENLSNSKLREETTANFYQTDTVLCLTGFVPTSKVKGFESVLNDNLKDRYYIEMEDAKKDDPMVPIALKNNSIVEPFESLTAMYALPRYNEVDPTPLLAPFYWFFFGMMAADLGYGLLLALACFLAPKFMKVSAGLKKNMKFFGFLGIATMIWGVIYSSAFGIRMPWNPILDSGNFNSLLMVSVIFGCVHIFFGLGIKAYMLIRDGAPLDAFFDVGLWYMALAGGIGFLVGGMASDILPASVASIFKWIMIVGMAGIVLFGARDAKNPAARLVGGAYSLYGISSYVGDFVSYSRLMALGLSGGFIAYAVNYICGMMKAAGVLGLVFAAVVFVIFHLFNMFLSFLSGYVHSARLTYVEFFGKFYGGGGTAFRKFVSEPTYIEYK